MLLLGDIGLGLLLTVVAIWRRSSTRGKRAYELGEAATAILASFGLAVLLIEGLLPGFWMIASYSVFGGHLEDYLIPGSTVGSLLRALAIGLVISTYAAVRAYITLLEPGRKRSTKPPPSATPLPPTS